jgi:hypothetical protein
MRPCEGVLVNSPERDNPLQETELILPDSELRLFLGGYDGIVGISLHVTD